MTDTAATADDQQQTTDADETAAAGTSADEQYESPTDEGRDDLPDEVKAILAKERKAAREAEKRARAAERERDELRRATMSEAEKALDKARDEGRAEGRAEMGAKLVRAEIRAAVGDRIPRDALDRILEPVNLTAFIGEDGEVDAEKVSAYVEGIAPNRTFPDLGQGARKPAPQRAGSLVEAVTNHYADARG